MEKTKKTYEVIREIFNSCSGNQMRDVYILEVETDDIEAYLREWIDDEKAIWERTDPKPGTSIFEVNKYGLRERFSFSEV